MLFLDHELEGFLSFRYHFNPSCTKVFGTHTFYERGREGGGVEPTLPFDSKNGRLYELQLWQAIRTIYER